MTSPTTPHHPVPAPAADAIIFLNEVEAQHPDAISFAPGRPHDGYYAVEQINQYLDAYLGYLRTEVGLSEPEVVTTLFQYGRTAGNIQGLVARMLEKDEGIRVPAEAIVITAGCQEALLLTLMALFPDRRDVLLVASPCYPGVTGAATVLGIAVETVAESDAGLEPEAVTAAVAAVRAAGRRVRALYLMADLSNPSGTSMPMRHRRRLLEIAADADILLLEDNPYGLFGHDSLPTLKALDDQRRVVYLGTFSKSGFPGLRIGYAVADQVLAAELAKVKSVVTVNTSPITQALAGGLLLQHDFGLRQANAPVAEVYRSNMALLLRTLDEHLPEARRDRLGVRWRVPNGGFFLVVDVPFEADESLLRRSAGEYGVIWTPMRFFYPRGGGERRIRLSCSSVGPDDVVEGAGRLVSLIADRATDEAGARHR